ncbi:hypothetical protein GobsT_44410 [Gemmata obscuriglobus]|nr:SMI1/KNR4 family protein [Gemmata obscuriglobus]QEG29643.1 hypothetical protein GobsT_44410 [Gemmata obscuriglobus]VTS08960.1 unnamed protein product [Gemmata obscuriglobus UQM 2246]
MAVRQAAEDFVARATAAGQVGRPATAEEIAALQVAFGDRYPAWLTELWQSLPLCGLRLGWRSDAFKPWEGPWWLVWPTPAEAVGRLKFLLTENALAAGYLLVALDGSSGADPYYIQAGGDDPPLVRLYHDGEQLQPDDITPVAPSLSAFLRVAEVRPLTDEEAEALMLNDAEPGAAPDTAI